MTSVRLLEILPIIFGELYPNSGLTMKVITDMKWLHDFMDWGRSSLAVVARYWKQALVSLLGVLKKSCSQNTACAIRAVERLMSSGEIFCFYFLLASISLAIRADSCMCIADNVAMDEMNEIGRAHV